MKNTFIVTINIIGILATALTFLWMCIRAFNATPVLVYNDGFVMIAVIASTWLILSTIRYK